MDRLCGDSFLYLLGHIHFVDRYAFVARAIRIDRSENGKEESFHRDIVVDSDSCIIYIAFICVVLAESDINDIDKF